MTEQSNVTTPEIFFRATDRLQMGSCLAAVAKESKSVVMYSQSNELLDYYGASFLRRLKNELTTSDIEVFMPADSEAMLQRFNQLLSDLSLDVATKTRSGKPPEKVWVVHDANAMSAHELELLARLVQQFPGSGVSAVLMFSAETSSADTITRQNKQFVSWALEMPTAEQKLSTIQQARKSGHEEAAVQFFNRLTKRAVKADTPSVRATETAAAAAAKASKPAAKPAPAKKKSSNGILWALIVIAMLILSVGVAAWMNPDMAKQVWDQGSKLLSAKEEPVKSEEPPGPPAALKEEAAKDEANNPMPVPGAPDAKTQQAAQASEPAAPSAPAVPVAAPIKEPVADKVITELPDAAVQGRLWLKGLPAESFVIQHKAYASVKDAQAAMKGKDWLVNARIVPVFADGKDEALFGVVTGPFKSKERAKNASIRLGLASDATIVAVPAAQAQAVPNKSKP
jgi:flagellar basal body-associated protein FliL